MTEHGEKLLNHYIPGSHLENFIRGGSSIIIKKGGHDKMKYTGVVSILY